MRGRSACDARLGPCLCSLRSSQLVGSMPATTLAARPQREKLEMYVLEGPGADFAEATKGLELVDISQTADGTKAEAVLTGTQAAKIRAQGVKVDLLRNDKGQTVTEQAALRRSTASPSGAPGTSPAASATSCMTSLASNPQLVKLEVLGHTHQGREIIALKLTQGAREAADGSRPAVLYSSLQHAREWISVEVNRRTLQLLRRAAGGRTTRTSRTCSRTRELWFVLSANPDGYQYTFDHRAAVAQEPARQRRRRPDHRRRRRRPEPQLQRALGLRRRGLVDRTRSRRHVPRPERRRPSPRRRRCRA